VEKFDIYTLEQVDSVFGSMKTIKEKEKYTIESEDNKVKIVPLFSGGTVGGVVWKITFKMQRIVYICRPYMEREFISDGLILSKLPKMADMVIIDANVIKKNEPPRCDPAKQITMKQLKELVHSYAKAQGNIIIPCDSGSRGLELMVKLKKYIEKRQEVLGSQTQILYMHTMSDRALDVARCHLEWMSSKISQSENGKASESEFVADKTMSCFTSIAQLNSYRTDKGKIIFCTFPSVEYGLSKILLHRYIEDRDSLFVFPFRPPFGNNACELINAEKGKGFEISVIEATSVASLGQLPRRVEPAVPVVKEEVVRSP
jgi:Cft2 family RNA processing exonuclease